MVILVDKQIPKKVTAFKRTTTKKHTFILDKQLE